MSYARKFARLSDDSRIHSEMLYAVCSGMPGVPAMRYVFGGADCEPLVSLMLNHATYPHIPGYLYDCPACEAKCFCQPEWTECVHCAILAES